jgi:hypothetical protein
MANNRPSCRFHHCYSPLLDVPPKFTAFQDLSIPVHVRVDNITYSFLGSSNIVNGSVNHTSMVITPTQTKLTAEAGPMQFNVTFLNPIEVHTKFVSFIIYLLTLSS